MIQKEKICNEKHYRIFYSNVLKNYIFSLMITKGFCYEMFFRITEEEYQILSRGQECQIETELSSERFLCSQKKSQNKTNEQKQRYAVLKLELNMEG